MIKRIIAIWFAFMGVAGILTTLTGQVEDASTGRIVGNIIMSIVFLALAYYLWECNPKQKITKEERLQNQMIISKSLDEYVDKNSMAFMEKGVKLKDIKENFGSTISKVVDYYHGLIIVDDPNKEFYIVNNRSALRFDYDKLTNFEYYENGESIISGKGAATVAGGLTFGLLGALAGSSGKRKQTTMVEDQSVKLFLNDLNCPSTTINLSFHKVKKGSFKYQQIVEKADEIMGILLYIQNNK